MEKEQIIKFFNLLSFNSKGILDWLSCDGHEEIFNRLSQIETSPLSKVQLNQLLLLSIETGISDGFYKYYWYSTPEHLYDVKKLDDFKKEYCNVTSIGSLNHLRWGIVRIYTDCLICFGNIRDGFRFLSSKTYEELEEFFSNKLFPTQIIKVRGNTLRFKKIKKTDRYLISEMACKSYGETPENESELKDFLIRGYQNAKKAGLKKVKIKNLLDGNYLAGVEKGALQMCLYSITDILEEEVESETEIEKKYLKIAERYISARKAALKNTEFYLSLVNDLDVYVATSMRTQEDFIRMADSCEKIFKSEKLKELDLRYFDPTISAADGHEDKGLIECLMVKCAKVLIYTAGEKESYGKDAEAAMALSLGKPVIFLCDKEKKKNFYKDVHPLSRLINFESGVACGAIVCESEYEVSEILYRIFSNEMEYEIEQSRPGYFRLLDKYTKSVVRLQTNSELISSSFWNYYHNA